MSDKRTIALIAACIAALAFSILRIGLIRPPSPGLILIVEIIALVLYFNPDFWTSVRSINLASYFASPDHPLARTDDVESAWNASSKHPLARSDEAETVPITVLGQRGKKERNTNSLSSAASSVQNLVVGNQPLVYTIKLPRGTKWQSNLAISLVREMALYRDIVFRITNDGGETLWQVIDVAKPVRDPGMIVKSIKSVYAQAEVSDPQPYQDHNGQMPFHRRVEMVGQAANYMLAIQDASAISKSAGDYLSVIPNIMSNLDTDETVSYLIYASLADRNVYEWAENALYFPKFKVTFFNSFGFAILALTGVGIIAVLVYVWRMERADRQPRWTDTDQVVDRLNQQPLIRCHIVTEVNTSDEARLYHYDFDSAFLQYMNRGQGLLRDGKKRTFVVDNPVGNEQTSGLRHLLELKDIPLYMPPVPKNVTYEVFQEKLIQDARYSILTASELAALWHLPHEDMNSADIAWIKGSQVAAPPEFRGKSKGVFFGVNKVGGRESEIYIPDEERTHHGLFIGKTGMGKTSTLHALVHGDIAAGRGVAVVDPMGGLVRRVLQHSIPPERENDVVILDVDYEFDEAGTRVRYPPPMNLLARPQQTSSGADDFNDEIAAGQVISVLSKVYEEGFEQTEMAHTLMNGLITLAADEQVTLLDIDRIFDDVSYREGLLERLDNIIVERAWERFESRRNQMEQRLYPVLRRLDAFYRNPSLAAITCHPDPLDIVQLMAENKIILVSLQADERKIPELERMVLGATIISQIQMAALVGGVKQPPYLLYVDEVHNFVTTALDVMARQARQKGLGLYVATQYLKALSSKTLDAFMGTVGTIGIFETDDADAKQVATYMKPSFDTSDLTSLGKHKMAVSMRSADGNRAAFSLDPAYAPPADEAPEQLAREVYLRRKSVENFTPKSYSVVKAWLDDRYKPKKQAKRDEQDDLSEPLN